MGRKGKVVFEDSSMRRVSIFAKSFGYAGSEMRFFGESFESAEHARVLADKARKAYICDPSKPQSKMRD